jgi:hypothetical protein
MAKALVNAAALGRLGREELLELYEQCAAELRAIDDLIFDSSAVADDVEHYISCHAKDVPTVARSLAKTIRDIRKVGDARHEAQMDAMEKK